MSAPADLGEGVRLVDCGSEGRALAVVPVGGQMRCGCAGIVPVLVSKERGRDVVRCMWCAVSFIGGRT